MQCIMLRDSTNCTTNFHPEGYIAYLFSTTDGIKSNRHRVSSGEQFPFISVGKTETPRNLESACMVVGVCVCVAVYALV